MVDDLTLFDNSGLLSRTADQTVAGSAGENTVGYDIPDPPSSASFPFQEALKELLEFRGPMVQPTLYDSCWAARLREEDGTPAYPALCVTLLEKQHADGSWGSRVPYVHDRLLTTLAILIFLATHDQEGTYREQREAGERYIRSHAPLLRREPEPTVGFELILPTLIEEARLLGLALPYDQFRPVERERQAKLSLLPQKQLFEEQTTALFSLEGLADHPDVDRAAGLLLENGSLACSPSATAFLMGRAADWRVRYPRSTTYLEKLMATHGGALPHFGPADLFLRGWVFSYLYYGGMMSGQQEVWDRQIQYLYNRWHPEGVGFCSVDGVVADADDTVMVLLALHRAGREVDASCLLGYERAEWFSSFPYERHPSTSVNLHILEALELLPRSDRERVRTKIVQYLLQKRQDGVFWSDKWHASSLYTTSQALIVLPYHAPGELEQTLQWLLSVQYPSGAWGHYFPTVEETAMALLALVYYYRHHRRPGQTLPTEALHRAARYLYANPLWGPYPELWISKVLYAPVPIIRSLILSTLVLYDDTFGREHL